MRDYRFFVYMKQQYARRALHRHDERADLFCGADSGIHGNSEQKQKSTATAKANTGPSPASLRSLAQDDRSRVMPPGS
jgi:hypothetical protein